ncbi:outer membrane beta-barrel protein [Hymenobacter puniceus]|uniref:outer membrane beta-barrel protein n=1 Tax=Hymenobacter sp. BT190 TaxID=2763505 RepID=UPI0016516F7D|nr:outer membrane beta-barrel protein [Hymenobacter sp. BT190]MBC6699959.1 PorT family protein [Hymenobacter sp. BT190]
MRLLLLPFLLAAAPGIATAQATPTTTPPTEYRTWVGIQAGYSRHELSGSEVDFKMRIYNAGYGPLQGTNHPLEWFTVGAVVRRQLHSVLFLQGELNYVRKGGQMTDTGFYDQDPIVINYLQLPVLLRLAVPVAGPVGVHLEGGAALNLALNEREINQRYYAPANVYTHNGAILSPAVGGGLDWRQGRHAYSLNFRYSPDTHDFFQREFMGTAYTLRHSGYTATLGVLFGQP